MKKEAATRPRVQEEEEGEVYCCCSEGSRTEWLSHQMKLNLHNIGIHRNTYKCKVHTMYT